MSRPRLRPVTCQGRRGRPGGRELLSRAVLVDAALPGQPGRLPSRPVATIETGAIPVGTRPQPCRRILPDRRRRLTRRLEEHAMSSLLIGCSSLETYAPEAADGPSWWGRLTRLVANEYRIRRAEREVAALDERMLRDLGLDHG